MAAYLSLTRCFAPLILALFAAGLPGAGAALLRLRAQNGTMAKEHLSSAKAKTASNGTHLAAPCQCEANNPAWLPTTRTIPKCVFVDLGAADGNSLQNFLNNGYGPVANCPSGQWEAFLVEANPQFTPALTAVAGQHPGIVHNYASTAAYMCQGKTTFSIDPDAAHNHWGSSMKRSFNGQQVTVPTINVMQLIAQNVIQGDWVILKVDIEGAEYDLMPCLSQFSKTWLIDIIFVEEHGYLAGDSVYTPQQYAQSKASLKQAGVSIPDTYHSGTF